MRNIVLLLVATLGCALAAGCGESSPRPRSSPLVGSWTTSWTLPTFAPIDVTGSTEIRADGTWTATAEGTDGLYHYTYSGNGSYTYANGVVTFTGRGVYREGPQTIVLDESGKVSIAWINDNRFEGTILESSDPHSLGWTHVATRAR
jgi:hypothetical protein